MSDDAGSADRFRNAIAFLEARLQRGVEGEIALDDVLAAALNMDDATEPTDIFINIAKLLGGMAHVAMALIALRQKEHGDSAEDTLGYLNQRFAPE